MKNYDVIIIGAGPAGLSAGLYSSRYNLKTLILEKDEIGGRANQIKDLETYPGVPKTNGAELAKNMLNHAKQFGAEYLRLKPRSLKIVDNLKIIHTRKGDFSAKAIILATGMIPKKFNVPGEDEFAGMGVSYCATCDAEFYKDQIVCVIGSNNQAISEGLMICQYAQKVIVITKFHNLKCNSKLAEEAKSEDKMSFIFDSTLEQINGEINVNSITIKHTATNKSEKLKCDGVFLYGGMKPETSLYQNLVKTDDEGYLHPNDDMSVNDQGLFAAGDVRKRPLSQVLISASDGAVAAFGVQQYISSLATNHTDANSSASYKE